MKFKAFRSNFDFKFQFFSLCRKNGDKLVFSPLAKSVGVSNVSKCFWFFFSQLVNKKGKAVWNSLKNDKSFSEHYLKLISVKMFSYYKLKQNYLRIENWKLPSSFVWIFQNLLKKILAKISNLKSRVRGSVCWVENNLENLISLVGIRKENFIKTLYLSLVQNGKNFWLEICLSQRPIKKTK